MRVHGIPTTIPSIRDSEYIIEWDIGEGGRLFFARTVVLTLSFALTKAKSLAGLKWVKKCEDMHAGQTEEHKLR
jgi:hypothetical protein